MRPKNHGGLKKRNCLKCSKEFDSTSVSNRICFKCNGQNSSLRDVPQTLGTDGRVVRKSVEGGH